MPSVYILQSENTTRFYIGCSERDGLVQVVTGQNNKRPGRVVLTDVGRKKLAASMALWERAQQCFETVFGEKKAETLRASLEFFASSGFAQAFRQLKEGQPERARRQEHGRTHEREERRYGFDRSVFAYYPAATQRVCFD
jgi:hypothetical protein